MAIEIKNGAVISAPFKTTPTSSITGETKTEFALTLSGVRPTERSNPVNRADSVVITNTVTQIRKSLESSSQSSADVERLMRIKAAIENGTYEINPDKIAAKMMQFEFSSGES